MKKIYCDNTKTCKLVPMEFQGQEGGGDRSLLSTVEPAYSLALKNTSASRRPIKRKQKRQVGFGKHRTTVSRVRKPRTSRRKKAPKKRRANKAKQVGGRKRRKNGN